MKLGIRKRQLLIRVGRSIIKSWDEENCILVLHLESIEIVWVNIRVWSGFKWPVKYSVMGVISEGINSSLRDSVVGIRYGKFEGSKRWFLGMVVGAVKVDGREWFFLELDFVEIWNLKNIKCSFAFCKNWIKLVLNWASIWPLESNCSHIWDCFNSTSLGVYFFHIILSG